MTPPRVSARKARLAAWLREGLVRLGAPAVHALRPCLPAAAPTAPSAARPRCDVLARSLPVQMAPAEGRAT